MVSTSGNKCYSQLLAGFKLFNLILSVISENVKRQIITEEVEEKEVFSPYMVREDIFDGSFCDGFS